MTARTHASTNVRASARPTPLRVGTRACLADAFSRRRVRRRAFTIVELLVAIAVIALLVTLIVSIATQALSTQKEANTRGIMRGVELAIDQFALENPLRNTYDAARSKTFGPYPPYVLAGAPTTPDTVASLLEPDRAAIGNNDVLRRRLTRDLGGNPNNADNWVQTSQPGNLAAAQRLDDDNRSLMAYLAAFAPTTLSQVPSSPLKPLAPNDQALPRGEYLNPRGAANVNDDPAHRQILGVHDAWGVPLDYFLALRVEWAPETSGYRIVERVPMLRSLGIEREVYDARFDAKPLPGASKSWIFSREMAGPLAIIAGPTTGLIDRTERSRANGWVRGVAIGPTGAVYEGRETYGYRPDLDPP